MKVAIFELQGEKGKAVAAEIGALAAQDAGLTVLGYCNQARFLINSGIGPRLDAAPLAQRAQAQHLLMEHEMGELFKVIGLGRGQPWDPLGFAQGDRTHTL